ncbi:ABC transporter six-transmembrane domain-containing protein [Roseovarius sp. EL26]|uniref:ABC transporter six-transmembrane domain-containing protein n=1 Tax=Roseovarius sp. EL26 TaxID=2126672 RepID=UPI0013C42E80|nr:ABC transporter six-transmembrane domain-containing protein [Roseovarius sp. EL26]
MIAITDRLSIGTLFRAFWGKVAITWGLTLAETAFFALMPLMIGRSIDGLLKDDWLPFQFLIAMFVVVLVVATGRRIYDTRAYGTMRVELGKAQYARSECAPVSVTNARVLMGRELVDFLEDTAPNTMTALVQVIASVVILLSFHTMLALSTGGSAIVILLIYMAFSRSFFRTNAGLNEQAEQQVTALESASPKKVAAYFLGLRKLEVKLSDMESIVYGKIFAVLMAMVAFNLWFAATKSGASAGDIFAIVTYSTQFLGAAVTLPYALQSLTRLSEITHRINRSTSDLMEEGA